MATWKKVIVSGSSAELAALHVDNLSSGVVTGASGNLTTTAINGSGDILATTGATGVSISGSFSGSFEGKLKSDLSSKSQDYVVAYDTALKEFSYQSVASLVPNTASYANNATSASYASNATSASQAENANTATSASYAAVAPYSGLTGVPFGIVSGSSQLDNASISGLTLTNVSATGSFTGSFSGDGSGLTGIASTLIVSGSTGAGTVNLKTQSLTIQGTANEVETSVSGQTVTIGLPDDVTLAGDLLVQGDTTLQGNLTVNGTTTTIDTQNLFIEDKFALFASGSTSATDGGFVIQSNADGTGYAFGYDASANRWALQNGLSGTATAFSGNPKAYVSSVQFGDSFNRPSTPSYGGTQGYGNIWVSTDTSDIWIYA